MRSRRFTSAVTGSAGCAKSNSDSSNCGEHTYTHMAGFFLVQPARFLFIRAQHHMFDQVPAAAPEACAGAGSLLPLHVRRSHAPAVCWVYSSTRLRAQRARLCRRSNIPFSCFLSQLQWGIESAAGGRSTRFRTAVRNCLAAVSLFVCPVVHIQCHAPLASLCGRRLLLLLLPTAPCCSGKPPVRVQWRAATASSASGGRQFRPCGWRYRTRRPATAAQIIPTPWLPDKQCTIKTSRPKLPCRFTKHSRHYDAVVPLI